MDISIDGAKVNLPDTVLYKGMMLSGVPNFNFVFGYTNNSWTLRADLVNRYVIRLLDYLDSRGYDQATPTAPANEPADMPVPRPHVRLRPAQPRRASAPGTAGAVADAPQLPEGLAPHAPLAGRGRGHDLRPPDSAASALTRSVKGRSARGSACRGDSPAPR